MRQILLFITILTTAFNFAQSKNGLTLKTTPCIPYLINSYGFENPMCQEEFDTGIILTISTPAAQYSFDNGITWTTNSSMSNLKGGATYCFKIKDNNGCISETSCINTLNQEPILKAPQITINQPTCTSPSGFIVVNETQSQYSFDDGHTWSKNPTSNPLSPGTYQIRIMRTVGNQCISYATTAVINPPANKPSTPSVKITQPLSCSNPYGSITVISVASEYSFDNGITYSTNQNSGNILPGDYLVKEKNNAGCESDAVSIKINPPTDYPPMPTCLTSQPTCNNPNGSINITTTATEYSFDDGVTWSTINTKNNLQPGTYLLKIKNTLGCESTGTSATLIPFTDFPLPPSAPSAPQSFCIQQNATLNDITSSGQNIKWYDSQTGSNLLANTMVLQNVSTYYASQTINGCESARVPVTINIQNTPLPTGNDEQSFCASSNATVNDISINGQSVKWYDSAINSTPISNTTALSDGKTYYATQTENGCESTNRLAVKVSLIATLNAKDYSELVCDNLNDGHEKVNLTDYNPKLIDNPTAYKFEYYNSQSAAKNQTALEQIGKPTDYNLASDMQTIYVRISSSAGCYQIVSLKLTRTDTPEIGISDTISFCEKDNVLVNAGAGFDSYLWSTEATGQQIKISQAGNYSLTVTKKHGDVVCSSKKDFALVASNVAKISNIETKDMTESDNSITVNVKGLGVYEYSMDGKNFQDSNEFTDLKNGQYTVYVRDKNGCGTVTQEVYLLMYPKYFTPNGDGYNDTWKIKLSFFEPELKVFIIDRYGKLLKQLIHADDSWDGTCNGVDLPPDDYWFVVTRKDGREYRGHFSLMR